MSTDKTMIRLFLFDQVMVYFFQNTSCIREISIFFCSLFQPDIGENNREASRREATTIREWRDRLEVC